MKRSAAACLSKLSPLNNKLFVSIGILSLVMVFLYETLHLHSVYQERIKHIQQIQTTPTRLSSPPKTRHVGKAHSKVDDSPLGKALINANGTATNPWVPPSLYCYKKGNDWSACAGDHFLYRPSTRQQLLSRQFMCTHEPMCWMQLDWQKTNPPQWSCPGHNKLRFYDMSNHAAVMTNAATLIEKSLNPFSKTEHEVFICNFIRGKTASDNLDYPFKLCPHSPPSYHGHTNRWFKVPPHVRLNVKDYVNDKHFKAVDAMIFGFDASMFEEWTNVGKPLILALWHVVNQLKCTHNSSQTLFDQVRELAFHKTLNHVIGGNTIYHMEYVRHYTGLNPVYLPATLISALEGLTWSGARTEFLINSQDHVDAHVPKAPSGKNIKLVPPKHEGRYNFADLTKYAGVVVLPYSITNGKSVEQYAMNIPMFAPTVEFAKAMINDRTATYGPYCHKEEWTLDMTSGMHPDKHDDSPYDFNPNVRIDTDGKGAEADVKFWISFAELYRWPCVKYFASWDEMYALLESADRHAMSACMKQANKWRLYEEMQSWCWVVQHINSKK